MLYLIGLGLGDHEDITIKGLNAIKKCKRIYLEHYTSILSCSKEDLEKYYNCSIIIADREQVESFAHQILKNADIEDVALLVVGDPFAATTHSDLVIRANEKNIPVQVIHNASIMSAIACCGLQVYFYIFYLFTLSYIVLDQLFLYHFGQKNGDQVRFMTN